MPTYNNNIKVKHNKTTRTVVDKYGRVYLNFEPGNQYYVSSVSGSSAYDGKTWGTAKATVAQALALCTASNGDVIWIAPGHAESITSTSSLPLNVIGVTVIGLGNGALRPTFTYSSSVNACINISVASVWVENILCVAGIDSINQGFNITAADCTLRNIEWRDATNVEAKVAVLTGTSADRLTIDRFYHNGYTAGDACTHAFKLLGVDSGLITNCRFHGNYSTAIIEMVTTACTKMNILDCVFNETGTTDLSKNVVDTVGTSTWYASGYDLAAGCSFSGGSGAALAKDDVSAVLTAVNALQTELNSTTGIASFPSGGAAANNVSMAEVLRFTQENIINGSGGALPTNGSLFDMLAGNGGILTFPAAAAPANNVSIAEVLRAIYNQTALGEYYNNPNYLAVTADMTSATWNTAAAHEIATVTGAVKMIILPEVTGTITSVGGNATLILGDETTTNSLITSSDAEGLAQGEWWVDSTVTRTIITQTLINAMTFCVANGKDIGYTIGTEALTGGSIVFHIWWVPINATGAVAAGAGGAL